ncbi:MAG: hypothetical protein HY964_00650 [Ignavibacteriales bacterium]|nr:hypothetical protein [Ignavibacteriales bacterium]
MDFFLKTIIVLLFIIPGSSSITQIKSLQINQPELEGGKILKTESYNGNSLWGYIDGGADLYLEYGFVKLLVQQIFWQDYNFKLEFYEMKNNEAAFGVFSVSHRKCIPETATSGYNCKTPHMIQMIQGCNFIRIINENGTEPEQNLSTAIAKIISNKNKDINYSPPRLFSNHVFKEHLDRLKYFNGTLGIQNGFPEWNDFFEGLTNYSAYLLPIETDTGHIYLSQITFANESEKNIFYKNVNMNLKKRKYAETKDGNIFKAITEISSLKIYYFESTLSYRNYNSYLKLIQKK